MGPKQHPVVVVSGVAVVSGVIALSGIAGMSGVVVLSGVKKRSVVIVVSLVLGSKQPLVVGVSGVTGEK